MTSKKGWKMENSIGLLTYKLVDNKKQIPFTPHSRYIRWDEKEKGVHKTRSEVGI